MLNFLKNKSKNNLILGVNCFVLPNGEMNIHWVLVSKKNGKIKIENQGIGSFENLVSGSHSDIPVMLTMDGKGILSKRILIDPLKSPIQQVIPNASEEEFLFQQTTGRDQQCFISIARKDFIDEVLKEFTIRKLRIIGISLGPFRIINLLEILDALPDVVQTKTYRLEYDRNKHELIDFSKDETETSYTIDNTEIPGSALLPFYLALSYYIPDEQELLYGPVTEQKEEYASAKIFRLAGWTMLIILFVVLFGNMMLLTDYTQKKQKLTVISAGNLELLNSVKKMKKELAEKSKFMEQAGISGTSRISWYADQIAQTIPIHITLEKMDIHPVISKIKKEKEIEIQPDKILIDGIAGSSELVNDWINDLRKLGWIEDVTVINYFRKESETTGSFSIEISIKRKREG